jgi:hypothetical protein
VAKPFYNFLPQFSISCHTTVSFLAVICIQISMPVLGFVLVRMFRKRWNCLAIGGQMLSKTRQLFNELFHQSPNILSGISSSRIKNFRNRDRHMKAEPALQIHTPPLIGHYGRASGIISQCFHVGIRLLPGWDSTWHERGSH